MDHQLDPHQLTNLAWFFGWLVAVGILFWFGLSLPLQTRFSALASRLYTSSVVLLVLAVVGLANVALILHDVHLDLTREKVFTPSARALEVVDRLDRPVSLTYFYNQADQNGKRAKEIVETMGRRNPLLKIRTVDPDRQPTLAENFGIKMVNAAVIEADGRRIIVNTVDESEIAIGIQRVLREIVVTVCFIEGHNEYPIDNYEFHTHMEGATGHSHDQSTSAVIKTTGHGFGRLRRSLESLGYDVRKIILATEGSVPSDCTLAIDAGPRTTYLPGESAALEAYLRQGSSLLLMYDLGFVLEPGLGTLMRTLGVALPQEVVADPVSHYATDSEMVAVTAYDPHPITRDVSFTFYPGVRRLELSPPAQGILTIPLIKSSKDSYATWVGAVGQRQIEPAIEPANGTDSSRETRQAFVLAAAIEGALPLSGSRPFRAVVIGDSDFASNSFYPYMANSDLALAMVRWLVREEDAIPIASRVPVPSLILLTNGQMRSIFLVVEVLLPLSVILFGGLVWWRRR